MDINIIPELIELAKSEEGLATAQKNAKIFLAKFPRDGCAANLSALLKLAGAEIRMYNGAGHLADDLVNKRHWEKIEVGDQRPGDVGVTYDRSDPEGADHIYLVVEVIDRDKMMIADNREPIIHERFASGKNRTPTEYFLRAT